MKGLPCNRISEVRLTATILPPFNTHNEHINTVETSSDLYYGLTQCEEHDTKLRSRSRQQYHYGGRRNVSCGNAETTATSII
jgi:hypothetical protein